MNLSDVLELDYLIQSENPTTVNVNNTPSNSTPSLSRYDTKTAVFSPDRTGIYEITVNNQMYTIEVIDNGESYDYASNKRYPNQTWGGPTDYDGSVNGGSIDSMGGVNDFRLGSNSGRYTVSSDSDHVELYNTGFGTRSFSNITVMVGHM